jgi:hypothetical protein
MTAESLEWLLRRTDEAVPTYLGVRNNSFVWVRDPATALHFLSSEHAKVMGGQMVPPCKAERREDKLNDTDTDAT